MEKFYNFMAFFASVVKFPWKVIKTIATLGFEYIERYFDYQRDLPPKAATGSFVTEVLIVTGTVVGIWYSFAFAPPAYLWVITFIVCLMFYSYRTALKHARKRNGWK